MRYLLQICKPDAPGDLIEIHDPSPEMIDNAVEELLPVDPNFLILIDEESDNLAENCEFVQTAMDFDDENDAPEIEFDLEVHFTDGDPYRQYRIITKDIEFVKRTIRMFALGVPPKIDSSWEYITQEILGRI